MLNEQDAKKFNKIYADTYSDIVRYVVCNVQNLQDSEDIVQNIYIDVAKGIPQVRMTPKYIMGIAKNKINDYYRFKYKEKDNNAESNEVVFENVDAGINIEQTMTLKYDTEKVWKYLTKKKVIIGKIFYLYYYEEFTIKEISHELNVSEANIKNHLYRTLKELNKFLGKEINK